MAPWDGTCAHHCHNQCMICIYLQCQTLLGFRQLQCLYAIFCLTICNTFRPSCLLWTHSKFNSSIVHGTACDECPPVWSEADCQCDVWLHLSRLLGPHAHGRDCRLHCAGMACIIHLLCCSPLQNFLGCDNESDMCNVMLEHDSLKLAHDSGSFDLLFLSTKRLL